MLRLWTFMQASFLDMRDRMEREDGAELVEYAIVIGLIAIFLVATLIIFRGGIVSLFTRIKAELDGIAIP